MEQSSSSHNGTWWQTTRKNSNGQNVHMPKTATAPGKDEKLIILIMPIYQWKGYTESNLATLRLASDCYSLATRLWEDYLSED